MIIDASALIAILRAEPEAAAFEKLILESPSTTISAVNLLETAIVIDASRDPVASRELDEYINVAGMKVAAVTEQHANIARQAYRDFGKGSGHRAQLNFGDCFAYALAKQTGETLLFKGNDFGFTDVQKKSGF